MWDCATKDVARQLATSKIGNRVRTALMLPGDKLLCARRGLASKLLPRDVFMIFAENNRVVARKIKRKAKQLGFKMFPEFHCDDLATLNVSERFYGQKVDYAFLDVCSPLTARLAGWISSQLAPNLSHGASVAITLCRAQRTSLFLPRVGRLLDGTQAGRALLSDTYAMLDRAVRVGNTECCSNWLDDQRIGRGNNNLHQRAEPFLCSDQLSPWYHDISVVMLAALRLIFATQKFDLDCCVEYKRDPTQSRGSRMTTFRLSDIRPCRVPLGSRLLADATDVVQLVSAVDALMLDR